MHQKNIHVSKIVFGLALLLLIIGASVFSIYGDLLWFEKVGYEQTFLKIILTDAGIWILVFLAFLTFAFINIKIAEYFLNNGKKKGHSANKILIMLVLLFAFIVSTSATNWQVVLKYINANKFGINDPIFNLDMGFYLFKLPFYSFVSTILFETLFFTMIITLISYLAYSKALERVTTEFVEEIERPRSPVPMYRIDWEVLKNKCLAHMNFLLALLFFIIGFGFFIGRYSILFSRFGIVHGAGFTDINVNLPLLNIMSFLSVIIGVLFLLNIKIRKWKVIGLGIMLLVIVGILGLLLSGIIQAFVVSPNEFNVEKPYIKMNINNTINAYGLKNVDERLFNVTYDLDWDKVKKSKTIGNIRVWDWRPLEKTYKQLQLFRTYYDFYDVDIDRYNISGKYTQVMISPREINTYNLQPKAKTWVNKHLVYTHGYGIIMNPVSEVTSEGLPKFIIKDIPPKSRYFSIKRPEIYFGEGPKDFAVVNTTTEEFDYPSGEQNIYTTYGGNAGVQLSSFIKRFAYAWKFGSIELLFSNSITANSKILLHRNIIDRAETIAPFITYDRDPYVVISNGRLYWIVDGYTTSNMYPYSEPYSERGINYIRNSVKVVIDAYNGDVDYYVIDKEDPVILTYMKIFPNLFKDFSEMPSDLKSHIRYPEDLFTIQAKIYSIYHMKDARVFYNKEDVWEIPEEIYRGKKQEMTPYYITMSLPDSNKEEFLMMIPFRPRGKENLVAWAAVKCDGKDYSEMVVFQFSKQKLIYGPMQIEARIDQDTDISQKITLWSQFGSSVLRGNTLVIPIGNSIIYIEPLYLEATESGTLPQLKRIIVAYGNKLTMKETLEEALNDIFGVHTQQQTNESGNVEEKIKKIRELYNRAKEALKSGDFELYAEHISEMEKYLK